MNHDMELMVRRALEKRVLLLRWPASSEEAQRQWDECLESVGARRIGRLLGMVVDKPASHVRVVDPLMRGGAYGFVEMPEEVAEKVVAIGIP
jgi:hypothetical protein